MSARAGACATVGDVITESQRSNWVAARGAGIDKELVVALNALASSDLSNSTLERFSGLIARFSSRLVATGVMSLTTITDDDCEQFLWARTKRNSAPSIHSVHLRRSAIRSLFAVLVELGEDFTDPSQRVTLPSKRVRRARPLTDDEITLLRTVALGRRSGAVRATLAVALAEATATTGEIPQLRWCDLHVSDGTIDLPGAAPIRTRRADLSPWGLLILKSEEPRHHSDEWIITRVAGYADGHSGQAATSNLLAKLLHAAGLTGEDVRPSSIRLWAGARVLGTAGIEGAANALGLSSLDATRAALSSIALNAAKDLT